MLDLNHKENIIFDLGGVILNIDYQLTSKAFVGLGFDNFDEYYTQKKQSRVFDLFETGKITEETFVEEISKELPRASEHQIIDAWNAMLLDLPGKRIELIQQLSKDHRVFLLSNTNEIHEKAFREIVEKQFGRYIFDELFEKAYLSHHIGLRKPDRECFEYVLDQNNLNPENTIFIDDSVQHVEGAKQAGIRALHLERGMDITKLFPGKFQ